MKKKRTCKIVDIDVPADRRINQKEKEKMDIYLARHLWKIKETVMPVILNGSKEAGIWMDRENCK